MLFISNYTQPRVLLLLRARVYFRLEVASRRRTLKLRKHSEISHGAQSPRGMKHGHPQQSTGLPAPLANPAMALGSPICRQPVVWGIPQHLPRPKTNARSLWAPLGSPLPCQSSQWRRMIREMLELGRQLPDPPGMAPSAGMRTSVRPQTPCPSTCARQSCGSG